MISGGGKIKDLASVLWGERSRSEFPSLAEAGAVAIVPIASIEQHGLALPVDTDCRTVEYVAQRGARLAQSSVLVTPTIPFGVSRHHMMFPGTISLSVDTVMHVLRDVCRSITQHGIERILILSGHGGNASTITAVGYELRYVLDRQIEACCWFDLVPDVIEELREGPCPDIGHAGEMEASCILALAPETVRAERMRWVPGITDNPALGTAAKGQRLLDAASKAIATRCDQMAVRPGHDMIGIPSYE